MRRRRSGDPEAARRLARQSLTRLARLRDATGHDIQETAQAAYDVGLTWQQTTPSDAPPAAPTTSPTTTTASPVDGGGSLPYGSEYRPYGHRVDTETKKGRDACG